MNKILTIIVSYNFEPWIHSCINSLKHSNHPTDILVIDNCSSDKTTDIIRSQYPNVRLICNHQNLGFGQANNIGMSIALKEHYDAVFLLNQDAWIDPQVLGVLTQQSMNNPHWGILSPIHLNGKGDNLDHGFATYTGKDRTLLQDKKNEMITAGFINAAFWYIPRKTLLTVGGFSPIFYHYGEDKDYINRLHFHQLEVGYCTGIFGFHDRENRKPDAKTFFHSEYVYLLSEQTRPDYPYLKNFTHSVLAGYKKAFRSFIKGKSNDCHEYLHIVNRLFNQRKECIRTRKQLKKTAPHFL